jgi:hypothetical protein
MNFLRGLVRILVGTPARFLGFVVFATVVAICVSPELQGMLAQGLNMVLYLLFNYVLAIAIVIWAIVFIIKASFKKGGRK